MAGKKRKERTPAEKSADFTKLAEKHANTALGAIDRIGKLARPGRYSWTPKQVSALERIFGETLGRVFANLKNPPTSGKLAKRTIFGD